MKRIGTPLAALVTATLLVLGGCGAGGNGGNSTTKSAPLSATNFADRVQAAQGKASTAHITMTFGFAEMKFTGQGVVAMGDTPETSSSHMTLDMGEMLGTSVKMETITLDGVTYMKMSELTNGKFIKIDPSDPKMTEMFGDQSSNDPAKQLEVFKDSVTDLKKVGAGPKIDGVATTKYVVTVDFAKAMKNSGQEIPKDASGQIPDTLVYTMFLGNDDLIRRMTFELAGSTMTMDYTKWGKKVEIKAPPADQITTDFAIPGLNSK